MRTSIPTADRALFRREGGLLLMRRVYQPSANLSWYRAAIEELPELAELAAGVMSWPEPLTPALVVVWCQAGHAHLVTRALTPLDPRLGRASVVSWPGALDITGEFFRWRGTPHIIAAGIVERAAAAEVLRWQ